MKKLVFKIGRNKEDSEKAVTPTVIFINTNHSSFKELRRQGFLLCFGWWDYSVKIGIIF